MNFKNIIDIEKDSSISSFDSTKVGGKALPLFQLVEKNIPIPQSFVITTEAFDRFVQHAGISAELQLMLSKTGPCNEKTIAKLRDKVLNNSLPEELKIEIKEKLKVLSIKRYAVRSSAEIEDSEEKSWAGEFDSFLNLPQDDVLYAVKMCWASMFNNRVITYAKEKSLFLKTKMAVLIQESIQSDVSGVCFTRDPLNIEEDDLQIEAVFGLGELLMQGSITPDRYIVERGTNLLLDVIVSPQKIACVGVRSGTGVVIKNINKGYIQKLSGKEIVRLAKIAQKVESVHGRGRDIEWCIRKNQIYILQSRPITSK